MRIWWVYCIGTILLFTMLVLLHVLGLNLGQSTRVNWEYAGVSLSSSPQSFQQVLNEHFNKLMQQEPTITRLLEEMNTATGREKNISNPLPPTVAVPQMTLKPLNLISSHEHPNTAAGLAQSMKTKCHRSSMTPHIKRREILGYASKSSENTPPTPSSTTESTSSKLYSPSDMNVFQDGWWRPTTWQESEARKIRKMVVEDREDEYVYCPIFPSQMGKKRPVRSVNKVISRPTSTFSTSRLKTSLCIDLSQPTRQLPRSGRDRIDRFSTSTEAFPLSSTQGLFENSVQMFMNADNKWHSLPRSLSPPTPSSTLQSLTTKPFTTSESLITLHPPSSIVSGSSTPSGTPGPQNTFYGLERPFMPWRRSTTPKSTRGSSATSPESPFKASMLCQSTSPAIPSMPVWESIKPNTPPGSLSTSIQSSSVWSVPLQKPTCFAMADNMYPDKPPLPVLGSTKPKIPPESPIPCSYQWYGMSPDVPSLPFWGSTTPKMTSVSLTTLVSPPSGLSNPTQESTTPITTPEFLTTPSPVLQSQVWGHSLATPDTEIQWRQWEKYDSIRKIWNQTSDPDPIGLPLGDHHPNLVSMQTSIVSSWEKYNSIRKIWNQTSDTDLISAAPSKPQLLTNPLTNSPLQCGKQGRKPILSIL